MRLTIHFLGTMLFQLSQDPDRARVLVPECGNTDDYPDPPGAQYARAHHTYLFVPAADLVGGGWMHKVKMAGKKWRYARLGAHPYLEADEEAIGGQDVWIEGRGKTRRGGLHYRIAWLKDQAGKGLRLDEDPTKLAARFHLPLGSLDWLEADGSGEAEGDWRLKGTSASTLPWIVTWTSAVEVGGFSMRLKGFHDGKNRRVRFASGRGVTALICNVEAEAPKEALKVTRRSPAPPGVDEIVDYDFAWLYRLVADSNGGTVDPVLPTWERVSGGLTAGASLPTCFPGGF